MRFIITFYILVAACVSHSYGESDRELEFKNVETIEKIEKISSIPTHENILFLIRLASASPKNESDAKVTENARARLSATPGFTQALKDHMHAERKRWKTSGNQTWYDRERYDLLNALGKIPDPRVVGILGYLLADTEWTSDPMKNILGNQDYTLTPPNSLLAARSLAGLIKDPPIDKSPGNYIESDVLSWQVWWEDVKTGKLTFSIKGQNTEYRFNTDGTWKTSDIIKPRKRTHNDNLKRDIISDYKPKSYPVLHIISEINPLWILVPVFIFLTVWFFWKNIFCKR